MISIVVPACGQVGLTSRCVGSIRRWTPPGSWELVLVDNGSTAEESQALERLVDGQGVYLRYPGMLGYPRAINEGVGRASGEFVCLMNNDAAFLGPWAERLIRACSLDARVIVSPIVDNIGQPCQRLGDRWAPGRLAEVGMLFFVCVLMRRALFEEMGGLDESFGLGNGEDVAFCRRVLAAGGRLLVEPGVMVTHAGSATFVAKLGVAGYQELVARNQGARDCFGAAAPCSG